MYSSFIISIILVTIIVSFLIAMQRKRNGMLSMEFFSFKFKHIGGALVMISIILSLFELKEDELYYDIRIIIANLGLIIIALSKDKFEVKDSNLIKIACLFSSTFVFYLVNHFMVMFSEVEKTIELSRFIFFLLVMYLISYHYFKSKLSKGV